MNHNTDGLKESDFYNGDKQHLMILFFLLSKLVMDVIICSIQDNVPAFWHVAS